MTAISTGLLAICWNPILRQQLAKQHYDSHHHIRSADHDQCDDGHPVNHAGAIGRLSLGTDDLARVQCPQAIAQQKAAEERDYEHRFVAGDAGCLGFRESIASLH